VSTLSCNVPVPPAVEAVTEDLLGHLTALERRREDHTLVCKRLGEGDPRRARERLRTALGDAGPVRARIDGVGVFERPPAGPAPVVYLAVDSPGLVALHERLCGTVPPVEGIEGPDYVPHVTLARGGTLSPRERDRLRSLSPTAVEWTVDRLTVYDATYERVVTDLSLPP
jgi:2'-5' RNA ligase